MLTSNNKMRLLLVTSLLIAATFNGVRASGAVLSDDAEPDLIAVLAGESDPADKALACKKLAIHGSAAAVPELARLLPDPQLSSWARIALEAIPGPEADDALLAAARELDGRLLIGMLNSIGVRRHEGAVELLAQRLQESDDAVAAAAAVALGRIANPEATAMLRTALATREGAVRSAVAEGCILCAETMLSNGQDAAAIELYDQIRATELPDQRLVEATRGAILARKLDGLPLLLETLQSPDRKMFRLALGTAREFPGSEVDQALADMMNNMEPAKAALVVQAMADRPDTVVLPAILQAAMQGDKVVRLSAVDALRRVGNESCLQPLLQVAVEGDSELADAARLSLGELPGDGVNDQIVTLLQERDEDRYALLLQLVGERRINAVDDVLQALKAADPEVRTSALVALGETIDLRRLPILIQRAVATEHAADAPVAINALRKASTRMPDRDACVALLSESLTQAPAASRTTLLEIVAEVGGSRALQTLAQSANSADPQLQDAGSRLLGKWNSVDAAPVLLDLAKNGPSEKYQVRALRGYIGIARKFDMPEAERADMCRNAINATQRTAERKLALDVLQLHPSAPGLKLATLVMKIEPLKEDATIAALVIAQKLGNKANVQKILSEASIDSVDLQIIKAEYGANGARRDVTSLLQGRVGKLPVILLPKSSYNASFGGDPAPGARKTLIVQYRLNGREGSATFPENAVIVFADPK